MANNCLVTTLKASVQNENLPYLGKLTVKLLNTSPLRIKAATPYSVKAINGGSISYADESNYREEINVTDPSYPEVNIKAQSANTIILINSKYGIEVLGDKNWQTPASVEFNLDELKYSTLSKILLERASEPYNKVSGKVSSILYSDSNIDTLRFLGTEMDLQNIDDCSSDTITELRFGNNDSCHVSGNINLIPTHFPNLAKLDVSPIMTGNVATFESDVITEFNLRNNNQIIGDVATMMLKNLASMDARSTEITGDVKDMATAMWNAGRKSGTLTIQVNGNNLTWDGVSLYDNTFAYPIVITFTENAAPTIALRS